jgi:hypothetical protein
MAAAEIYERRSEDAEGGALTNYMWMRGQYTYS